MTANDRPLFDGPHFDDPDDAREYQALRLELVGLFQLRRWIYPADSWALEAKIDDAAARLGVLLRSSGDEPGMIPRAFL